MAIGLGLAFVGVMVLIFSLGALLASFQRKLNVEPVRWLLISESERDKLRAQALSKLRARRPKALISTLCALVMIIGGAALAASAHH